MYIQVKEVRMKKDKMYPVRMNKKKLDVVLKYCKNKKHSLSKRVRELVDEIYDEYLKEELDEKEM